MLHEDDFDWAKRNHLIDPYHLYMIPNDDGTSTPYYGVNKSIQSLFGKLSSFGERAPVSLYNMMFKHLNGKTWQNMIVILKRQQSLHILSKDWGFGRNDKMIAHLIDITERGVTNEYQG